MTFGSTRRPFPVVDLTPLIDIIFQLVIFFMVSTTFISTPGIEVDLPRSSTQAPIRDKRDLEVWMTEAGAVYVDRQPVDWEELGHRFASAARRDPSTMVIIKADAAVSHGRVVALMDLARTSGLDRLAIATEPSPPEDRGR